MFRSKESDFAISILYVTHLVFSYFEDFSANLLLPILKRTLFKYNIIIKSIIVKSTSPDLQMSRNDGVSEIGKHALPPQGVMPYYD